MKSTLIPSTYAPLLADLKARVRAAQVKAAVAVNRELILPCWHVGWEILRAQQASAVAGRMPKSRFAAVAVEVMKAAREIERRLRA